MNKLKKKLLRNKLKTPNIKNKIINNIKKLIFKIIMMSLQIKAFQ